MDRFLLLRAAPVDVNVINCCCRLLDRRFRLRAQSEWPKQTRPL